MEAARRFAGRIGLGSPLRTVLLLPALLALGCSEPQEPIAPPGEDPVAVRQRDGSIEIRWHTAPPGRVQIFHGSDPDAISRTSPLGELTNGTFVASGLPPDRRPYFELVPETGAALVVAERLLPLEGAHNFRDLGGYRAADGRRVRWGAVYRSDHLGDLTDSDLAYLERLGIRTVCDFRGTSEREEHPDRLGADGTPRSVNPAIGDERFSVEQMQQRIVSGELGSIDFANLLIDGNRAFALDHSEQYRTFFELAGDPANLPLVFHCTAGKDRAGFAAAMLLLALGVPEADAMRDYLLTQPYTQRHIEDTLGKIRLVSLLRTDVERVRPLLGVQASYLLAAWGAAEQQYGSLDAYLERGLGLGPERRAVLQQLLLR